jgi:hypothetical protein
MSETRMDGLGTATAQLVGRSSDPTEATTHSSFALSPSLVGLMVFILLGVIAAGFWYAVARFEAPLRVEPVPLWRAVDLQ